MIAAFMRCCTVSSRDTPGPNRATSRSMRLTASPRPAASGDRIVGGSWQWSPARTSLPARSSGTQFAGSVDWHASSITATANRRWPRSWLSRPVSVAHTIRASSSTRSTASASSRRASASMSRASRRRAAFSPGSGCRRVHLSAWRNRAKASRDTLRACRASGCFSARMSTARSRRAGMIRAGWPSRTGRSPAASSFSSRLSTAWLLGAQARTVSPRATACADELHDGGRLPGAGRAVDHGHVLRREGERDGGPLGFVQRRNLPRAERGSGRTPAPVLPTTSRKLREPVPARSRGAAEGVLLAQPRDLVGHEVDPPGGVVW